MKRICTFVFIAVSFFTLKAQFLQYETTKTKWFELNAIEPIDCKLKFSNKIGSSVVLKYLKVSEDVNPNWIFTLCDNINCVLSLPDTGVYLPINNNELTEMKITVETKGIKDTSTVAYELSSSTNPSLKDTITFKMFLRWAAKVKLNKMEVLSVYPNPTMDVLTLNVKTQPLVTITNLTGKEVLKEQLSSKNTINVANLPKGIYFAKIATENGFAVAKFVKE